MDVGGNEIEQDLLLSYVTIQLKINKVRFIIKNNLILFIFISINFFSCIRLILIYCNTAYRANPSVLIFHLSLYQHFTFSPYQLFLQFFKIQKKINTYLQ